MNMEQNALCSRQGRAAAKTALITAVDYLARQAHTEKKLREKLMRKGFPAEEIDEASRRAGISG